MKAARLYAYDEHMQVDLTLEMVPEPTITAADEVIVRVGAAGLCRTDLHIIEGVWRGTMDPAGTFKVIPIEACQASNAKRHRGLQRLCHNSRFARPCMHLQLNRDKLNHTGKVLAYVFGRRKDTIFVKLKALLEPFGITRYYTDGWGAYGHHLDAEKHTVGKANTQKIESKHINLRTRIKRLVRRTICFSKTKQMHDL